MEDKKLEQILSAFVTEGRSERVTLKEESANVSRTLFTIQNQLSLLDQKNDMGFQTVNAALRGLDSRVTKLETNVEDTGKHNIEDLRIQLMKRRRRATAGISSVTARRFWVGVGMLFLGAFVTGCIDLMVKRLG